jgi:hypothetical protein
VKIQLRYQLCHVIRKLGNQWFYNHLISHLRGTEVVESQMNYHVENHILGQNLGFVAFQAPDFAGSLRNLPYPQLNPRVNCVGCGIDKVALGQVCFLQVILGFCASCHSRKCFVHVCYWGTI